MKYFFLNAYMSKNTSRKQRIKTNEIVNKFLIKGNKIMPEMHLKEPSFNYSACGPFAKNKD